MGRREVDPMHRKHINHTWGGGKVIQCIGSISIIHRAEGYCRHAHNSYVLQDVYVVIVTGHFTHFVKIFLTQQVGAERLQ